MFRKRIDVKKMEVSADSKGVSFIYKLEYKEHVIKALGRMALDNPSEWKFNKESGEIIFSPSKLERLSIAYIVKQFEKMVE